MKETAATFKDIQAEYDHLFVTEPIKDEARGYHWHAKTLFGAKKNARRVLDIACGGGYFFEQLRKLAPDKELVGIDISSQAIAIAQKTCPQAKYLLSVGEGLPFRDQTFDAITCLGSLEHFLNLKVAIDEMRRVATPDAVFYILVPNLYWYKDLVSVLFTGHKKTRNQTQERFACLGEWQELLEANGLKVTKSVKYNGIARKPVKQALKDILIPLKFSYHFVFLCRKA
jgi:ubiquinone/menaquinone biosynthesis C-methylase UbiE